MFGIGTGELLLILVIAMIVVGPERMVEFAGEAGRMLAKLRAETESLTQEFREAVDLELDEGQKTAETRPSTSEAPTPPVVQPEAPPQKVVAASEAERTASPAEVIEPPVEVTPTAEVVEPQEIGSESDDVEAEAVEIGVGELVPEDQDVEPYVLEQAVLVQEDVTESPAEGEDEDGDRTISVEAAANQILENEG